jgi:hypothetical protein
MMETQFAQICDLVETAPIHDRDIDRGALIGNWINSNPDTTSIARVNVFEADGKLQLQAFAVGPDGLIDWGQTTASVFAAGPASRLGAGLAATFDLGFAEVRFQAMIMKGLLVLAQFHLLKDDSGRDSYFLREYYAKTHELFNR